MSPECSHNDHWYTGTHHDIHPHLRREREKNNIIMEFDNVFEFNKFERFKVY